MGTSRLHIWSGSLRGYTDTSYYVYVTRFWHLIQIVSENCIYYFLLAGNKGSTFLFQICSWSLCIISMFLLLPHQNQPLAQINKNCWFLTFAELWFVTLYRFVFHSNSWISSFKHNPYTRIISISLNDPCVFWLFNVSSVGFNIWILVQLTILSTFTIILVYINS